MGVHSRNKGETREVSQESGEGRYDQLCQKFMAAKGKQGLRFDLWIEMWRVPDSLDKSSLRKPEEKGFKEASL